MANGTRVIAYAALIISIMAILIALSAQNKQTSNDSTVIVSRPPQKPPSTDVHAIVKITDTVVVPTPGLHSITVGWIYVNQYTIVQISANSTEWIILGNFTAKGPTAQFTVDRGNYTIHLIAFVPARDTVIKVDVKVGS